VLEDNNLLCCSLKDDYGLCSPNHSTLHLLQKSDVKLEDIFATVGRPYRWVQNLSGLVFLPNKLPVPVGIFFIFDKCTIKYKNLNIKV